MNSWPYNTARWQRLRLVVLSNEPGCRYCEEQGRTTPAVDVDHIVPVKQDPSLAFEQRNLNPLCRECHNGAKRAEEARGYRIGCDVDGLPLRGWK
jgi:5-methylcytosine-specific restriction endonuclease McrA